MKKPLEICQSPSDYEQSWLNRGADGFVRAWKTWIERRLIQNGLTIRLAQPSDIEGVIKFTRALYADTLKMQVTEYDLFRFIDHGNGLIIERQQAGNRLLVGCIFEVGYRSTDRTSYSLRLSIDETKGGRNLAKHIYAYSCLLAMEKGSLVKRGLIDVANLHSVYLHLNKMGFVFNNYFDDVYGLIPSFKCQLALTPEALVSYRISRHKLHHYVNQHQADKHYLLLDPNNLDSIRHTYQKTEFRVCALYLYREVRKLFALPAQQLGL